MKVDEMRAEVKRLRAALDEIYRFQTADIAVGEQLKLAELEFITELCERLDRQETRNIF